MDEFEYVWFYKSIENFIHTKTRLTWYSESKSRQEKKR